ncbi:MAG TPA: hypothetical protein VKI61_16725, partial [Chitinophagaceae bacterium]|nr:hypothetical protein [Chitinophagaceae bacterium]
MHRKALWKNRVHPVCFVCRINRSMLTDHVISPYLRAEHYVLINGVAVIAVTKFSDFTPIADIADNSGMANPRENMSATGAGLRIAQPSITCVQNGRRFSIRRS